MRAAAGIMADLAASGLTTEQLALVMELSAAVAVEARPSVDKAAENKRSYDREYQKERRKSRTKSYDDDDNRVPPKENIKPPVSEANASAAEPPLDPVKQMFDLGVAILTDAGIPKERARSFVGKLKQDHGEAKVLQALLDCRAKNISSPIDWLTKRFKVAKFVSPSGYEYRGEPKDVMREAQKRADWGTYYSAKSAAEEAA